MADHEIASFDEANEDLKTPQGADRYIAKKATHFEQPITTDSTVDGRDIAADGALLDTALQSADLGTAAFQDVGYFADAAQGVLADNALQPADNISALTNDAGYEANEALADQPEAEAGIENTKTMTSLRVAQAIAASDISIQNKFDGVTAPINSNDETEGYAVGSVWIVPLGPKIYQCTDATTNVAVWVDISYGLAEVEVFQQKEYLVATLPAGPVGLTGRVTDGDPALAWGAVPINSGGGGTPYMVWYNGTDWTIIGQ
ncbi:MAG: hypothetical protein DRQ89_13025 [Epsilonproteobacteria bacterium]|nr:MAG: hypothetical protein DRQ89_13025 [Campylobacterota bacterium]